MRPVFSIHGRELFFSENQWRVMDDKDFLVIIIIITSALLVRQHVPSTLHPLGIRVRGDTREAMTWREKSDAVIAWDYLHDINSGKMPEAKHKNSNCPFFPPLASLLTNQLSHGKKVDYYISSWFGS